MLPTLCFAVSPSPVRAQGESIGVEITGPMQPPGFSPALLTLHVYDTIVFINQSSPPASYAVTSSDGSFSSPAIAPGNQWTVTFNSVGAHEYHEAANPLHMVGEILVVANTVSLLPTPIPQVAATAVAAIQSGKSPPDTIVLPTPTPASIPLIRSSASSPIMLLLTIALLTAILMIAGIVIIRIRRNRLHAHEELKLHAHAAIGSLPQPDGEKSTRRFAMPAFLRRHKDDEDDDWEESYEDI